MPFSILPPSYSATLHFDFDDEQRVWLAPASFLGSLSHFQMGRAQIHDLLFLYFRCPTLSELLVLYALSRVGVLLQTTKKGIVHRFGGRFLGWTLFFFFLFASILLGPFAFANQGSAVLIFLGSMHCSGRSSEVGQDGRGALGIEMRRCGSVVDRCLSVRISQERIGGASFVS